MLTDQFERFYSTRDMKRFYQPAALYFGPGALLNIYEQLSCVDVVDCFIDSGVSKHPLVVDLKSRLAGKLRIFSVVQSPPSSQEVRRVVAANSEPGKALIAIGGGTTMDFAKSVLAEWIYGSHVGVGLASRDDMPALIDRVRPIFLAIPTTAGSGAENSRYYVVYDECTRAKVFGRTWRVVADCVYLDPAFLSSLPKSVLFHGAFDAFVHYLEALFCRYESSVVSRKMCFDGILTIMATIERIKRQEIDAISVNHIVGLQICSSLAGSVISNVRTGHIHEAGGALFERAPLCHGETLLVFLFEALSSYDEVLSTEFESLFVALTQYDVALGSKSLCGLAEWWEEVFRQENLLRPIGAAVVSIGDVSEAKHHIINRVAQDRVWVEKESPVVLTRNNIVRFVEDSLDRAARWVNEEIDAH